TEQRSNGDTNGEDSACDLPALRARPAMPAAGRTRLRAPPFRSPLLRSSVLNRFLRRLRGLQNRIVYRHQAIRGALHGVVLPDALRTSSSKLGPLLRVAIQLQQPLGQARRIVGLHEQAAAGRLD